MNLASRQHRLRMWPSFAVAPALLPGAAFAAAEPGAPPPQLLSDPALGAGYLLQLVIGLVVVLAGIAVLTWLMRRVTRFQSAAGDRLRVLGGLSVGTRERVVLIQAGEEQLLIGVASGQVRMLHALKQPLPPPSPRAPAPGAGFAKRLAQALEHARGGR